MVTRRLVILFTALLAVVILAPAPVVATDLINDDIYTDEFNSSNDYADLYGNNESLNKVAVNITENKVRFRTNITAGGGGGINDSNGLQVYIDSDTNDNVGVSADTADGENLDTFFEGLGSMTADYRLTVRDGGAPVIQVHDEEIRFTTEEIITLKQDGNITVFEIDRDTIGDPEKFDAKFAYVDEVGSADNINKFVWAPATSVEFDGTSVSQVKNAKFNSTVIFGDENVSDAASVEFTLTDDDGEIASKTTNDYTGNESISRKFTKDIKEINGTVNLTVEVNNGKNYSTDNDNLNNTVTIGEANEGTYNGTISLSVIEAGVSFGSESVDDDASIEFNLKNNSDGIARSNITSSFTSTPVNQTFTVNPDNFTNDGELSVEVNNDDDYPLDETKGVDHIRSGASLSSANNSVVEFNASQIGQRFTLSPNESDLTFQNNNSFLLNVSLESDEGENITQVNHTISYDNENLSVKNKSQDIIFYNASRPDGNLEKININNQSGEIEVDLLNLSHQVVSSGKDQTLYGVEFEFKNDLQDKTDQGSENAREFEITTLTNETETYNRSADPANLPFTSSSTPVSLKNTNTKITNVSVKHITEGGDMVDAPTKFEIDVNTNDGELDKIRLNKTNASGSTNLSENGEGDKLVIPCGNASNCKGKLQYTPDSTDETFNPSGPQYDESFFFNITIVDSDGNKYHVSDDTDYISEDKTQIDIYSFGDVNESTPHDEIKVEDVRGVLQHVDDETDELPWDDAEKARADINNDGKVTMTDVIAVYDKYL